MDGESPPGLPGTGVFDLHEPAARSLPLVLASPHSGSDYPVDLLAASRLDPLALRQSEDSFVDELFAAAPSLGAPLLSARFPRAYLDVNREAYELDPAMFSDALPDFVNAGSPRLRGASSVSIIPIIRRWDGWSRKPRRCSAVISSSIVIRCLRRPAPPAGETERISSSAIATARHALRRLSRLPPVFSLSAALSSRSTHPMPAGSRPAFTGAPARTGTHCRSRSTERFTWMSEATGESRASHGWSKTCLTSSSGWARSRRIAFQRR